MFIPWTFVYHLSQAGKSAAARENDFISAHGYRRHEEAAVQTRSADGLSADMSGKNYADRAGVSRAMTAGPSGRKSRLPGRTVRRMGAEMRRGCHAGNLQGSSRFLERPFELSRRAA